MKRKNKIQLKGIILFSLVLCLIFILPLKAEDESSSNTETGNSTKEENNIVSEDSSINSEKKSPLNLELFQLIKKENVSGKIEQAIKQSKIKSDYRPNRVVKSYIKAQQVRRSLYTTSLITLVGLNVADYFSTKEALKYNGLKEGNPIVKSFVKNDILFAAVKLGLTAYSYHFMQRLYKKNKEVAWVVSIVANLALSYIVYNNVRLINKHRAL